MRYLSVSSLGSFSVSAGASGELHGFTAQLLLENSRAHLRARCITFAGATVVILRVGELDESHDRQPDARRGPNAFPFSPQQQQEEREEGTGAVPRSDAAAILFVTIGSDDGYSEDTLRRLAALVGELCLFLNIDATRGGPNAPVLRQVLLYMEARLAAGDISLICQMTEWVTSPAIVATGFAGNAPQLMDELAREAFLPDSLLSGGGGGDLRRVPNYAAALLGHKMVLQTSAQWADVAASASGTECITLHDSDRYLAYIVACAFFAVPLQRSVYDVSLREQQIRALELRLRRFGIHRNNCTHAAAGRVMQIYLDALRSDARSAGDDTLLSRAAYFEQSFRVLISLSSSLHGENESDSFDSIDVFISSSLYHHPDVDFAALAERTFQIDGICLRNASYVGTLYLRFVPFPFSDGLLTACPRGYGLFLVSAPPRTARDYMRWQLATNAATGAAVAQLACDVLGAMETSFNCFQWLLSPPVESYEVPGLVHFTFVDRRRGSGVAASFHRMAQQRPRREKAAVAALRRLVALNISRAHTLVQCGFSEGLWGHLGMQFFFCVCAIDAAAAVGSDATGAKKAATGNAAKSAAVGNAAKRKSFLAFGTSASASAAGAQAPTQALGKESHTQRIQSESSEEFPFGSRKIPTAVLSHLSLRPMLIPDVMYSEPEELRVIEVYAVFIGAMSPADVSQEVKKLIRRQVLSTG